MKRVDSLILYNLVQLALVLSLLSGVGLLVV